MTRMPGPVAVEQVDEQALEQDVLLSIPSYLHKSIFRAFAAHRLAERERCVAVVEAMESPIAWSPPDGTSINDFSKQKLATAIRRSPQ